MVTSRRAFIQWTGTAGLAMASSATHAGANDDVVVALIGCGSQGRGVTKSIAAVPGVRIAYVCDPDEERRNAARTELGAGESVADLRRILDDKAVDAVIVATPDHWHAPASILACDAGKHVYVEKPCSHNLREARLLLEAARRNRVVVQHGTQSRSNPLIANAVRLLREGAIGDVLVAKAWNIQRRKNIGHQQPSQPPPGVDYDLWVGPVPMLPFQENRFHYNWRWWHAFGNGDVGNDGTHVTVTSMPTSSLTSTALRRLPNHLIAKRSMMTVIASSSAAAGAGGASDSSSFSSGDPAGGDGSADATATSKGKQSLMERVKEWFTGAKDKQKVGCASCPLCFHFLQV